MSPMPQKILFNYWWCFCSPSWPLICLLALEGVASLQNTPNRLPRMHRKEIWAPHAVNTNNYARIRPQEDVVWLVILKSNVHRQSLRTSLMVEHSLESHVGSSKVDFVVVSKVILKRSQYLALWVPATKGCLLSHLRQMNTASSSFFPLGDYGPWRDKSLDRRENGLPWGRGLNSQTKTLQLGPKHRADMTPGISLEDIRSSMAVADLSRQLPQTPRPETKIPSLHDSALLLGKWPNHLRRFRRMNVPCA